MIGFVLKYRRLLTGLSLVVFIGGAWVHGYFKGKNDLRGELAQKEIAIITESQKERENIDDQVRKMDSPAVDRALRVNGWMRTDEDT